MTTTDNPIEAVRARLDGGRRWIKGALDDDAGNACVMGACTDLDFNHRLTIYRLLDQVVADLFPERLASRDECGPPGYTSTLGRDLVAFNDDDRTDFTDMEKVLVEGIARWDLTHGGIR